MNMAASQLYDVAIIGGGIAGLSLALRLPNSLRIALFTKGKLGESNTRYAQGGLAVALGEDDSPEQHLRDTLAAGAGLCDEEAVRILVEQGPAAVRWLMQMGVQFDRAEPGSDAHATSDGLLLGREAAHSRWRVLHAGGDATGAEIERALMAAVMAAVRQRTSLDLYEETYVSKLIVSNGICVGVQAMDRDGTPFSIESRATVLANGGAGGLWLHTSNPAGATADGLALAWRAGAALTDLEFMQFHPTVLVRNGTSHLISEAVRGEGAYLRNHAGERFMLRYHPQAELAPRDVVARGILNEMLAEHTDCQYLDLRHLSAEKMHARFPTISAFCREQGLDLARDLLPVAPAAHYCMGGVQVESSGQTTLPGLYAVGEVACTGVHGANRLASNSLLEGLVFGLRIADGLVGLLEEPEPSSSHTSVDVPVLEDPQQEEALLQLTVDEERIQQLRGEVRHIMWQYVSLARDQEGLFEAKRKLNELRWGAMNLAPTPGYAMEGGAMNLAPTPGYAIDLSKRLATPPNSAWIETVNMLKVAELVVIAALQRCESRGSHWRRDYDATDERLTGCHYVFQRMESSRGELQHNVPLEEAFPHA
jgi:L-aspartate oxidase